MSIPSPYAAQLARVPVTRSDVELSGGTTAYWEYGQKDAATTIVAVHGFRGDHHGLESIVAFLPDLRVISPDLPGFGETAPLTGTPHDIGGYSAWLGEFVASVSPGAIILGHSFGSIVSAAAVAGGLATPALILVNPIGAPALSGPKGLLTRLAVFYYWAGAKLPKGIGTALLRNGLIVRVASLAMLKTADKSLRKFVHDQHARYFSGFADRDVLHEAFVTSVSHDVSEFAHEIAVPTLLVAAQQDDITPIEAVRALAPKFDNAQVHEIAGVGHLIHYETPEEAAGAIRHFLKRHAVPDQAGQ